MRVTNRPESELTGYDPGPRAPQICVREQLRDVQRALEHAGGTAAISTVHAVGVWLDRGIENVAAQRPSTPTSAP